MESTLKKNTLPVELKEINLKPQRYRKPVFAKHRCYHMGLTSECLTSGFILINSLSEQSF
jgi:hypothetical protein